MAVLAASSDRLCSSFSLARDGVAFRRRALQRADVATLQSIADRHAADRPGARLFGETALHALVGPNGAFGKLASEALGAGARAVRAVIFDKTPDANWSVAWHQDRTIAVRERIEVEGFGPWSRKAGVIHVAPPFPVLEAMVTLRAHLDPCPIDNAPLLIAPGSHRLGRVSADRAEAEAARLGTVACLADVGDVWAYATPILHASQRAAAPRRRRVLQIDFAAADLPGGLAWFGV